MKVTDFANKLSFSGEMKVKEFFVLQIQSASEENSIALD